MNQKGEGWTCGAVKTPEKGVRWRGLVHEMGRLLLQVPIAQRDELIRNGVAFADTHVDSVTLLGEYEAMFDQQVAHIKELGLHKVTGFDEADVEVMFERLREGLGHIGLCPTDRIPFLVVLPDALVCARKQMSTGKINMSNDLRRAAFEASHDIPDDVYLLIDVEIGLATRQCSGDKAQRMMYEKKRLGLNLAEFAALARVDPSALRRLSMNMVGAWTMSSPRTAPLWNRKAQMVSVQMMHRSFDNTGTPSAARRWVQEYTL